MVNAAEYAWTMEGVRRRLGHGRSRPMFVLRGGFSAFCG